MATKPLADSELVVDLVDTHPLRPPKLRIEINKYQVEHICPAGGADASITGDFKKGKEHRFTVPIPARALRSGLNEIKITTTALSWMVYDWIGFKTPTAIQLAPAQGVMIRSVKLAPWLSRKDGRLSQGSPWRICWMAASWCWKWDRRPISTGEVLRKTPFN